MPANTTAHHTEIRAMQNSKYILHYHFCRQNIHSSTSAFSSSSSSPPPSPPPPSPSPPLSPAYFILRQTNNIIIRSTDQPRRCERGNTEDEGEEDEGE